MYKINRPLQKIPIMIKPDKLEPLLMGEMIELIAFTFRAGVRRGHDEKAPPVYFEHIGREQHPDFEKWFETVFKRKYNDAIKNSILSEAGGISQ